MLHILCVADHVDPLVDSPNIKERFKHIDFVLGAGDLPMEYLGFISSMLNKPIYFVFGNHNLKSLHKFQNPQQAYRHLGPSPAMYLANYYGSTYIGGKLIRTKEKLLIAGMGGSIYYNGGENQFTDFQMRMRLIRLIPRLVFNRLFYGRYLDIFLTHSPPRHLGDKDDLPHRGFKSFRWFLKRFRPRYMIHGHIHLWNQNEAREIEFERTRIINVYDHYVLKVERPQ